MDKGLWVWRITMGVMAVLIVYGAFVAVFGAMNGDNYCPIVRDNGTEMKWCWSVDWGTYCPSIGCEKQSFWCGRPGCQCQEEFMNDNN